MVRPRIASALFVLAKETLQPYIRPLDCRGSPLVGPNGFRAVVSLPKYGSYLAEVVEAIYVA